MPIDSILTALQGGLIVSCQAPANSPLHQPEMIAAMAEAAVLQGAVGVRIDSPVHIAAVRERVSVPIIGLWKQVIAGSDVYITPQYCHAEAVAQAGADIIAIDATLRPRPEGETLAPLIERIRTDLQKPVMADVDTVASATAAVTAGADLLGTTLYGYTSATADLTPPGFDLLADLVKRLPTPCLCEGGIATPAAARQAIALGSHAVVVGTAITGIDLLVQQYCQSLSTAASSTKP